MRHDWFVLHATASLVSRGHRTGVDGSVERGLLYVYLRLPDEKQVVSRKTDEGSGSDGVLDTVAIPLPSNLDLLV